MFNIERWQEIFEAIAKNKLRTVLTGISVASGIFILVILLGVGKGLQNGISAQFANDAEGVIWFWAGTTTKEYKGMNPGRRIQLRNNDFELSTQKFEDQIDKKSAKFNIWNGNIVYGKETGTYACQGVSPDHQTIEKLSIIDGRFINSNDLINNTKVGVIGLKLKQDLFKDRNAIGEQIAISNVSFQVVGVFTDPGGEREETRVYLPRTTVQKVFGDGDKISDMSFILKKTDTYQEALAESVKFTTQMGQMLKSKNTIAPDDTSAIGINSTIENVKKFYDLNLYIRLFFWWVGICTIIAGVVGVSNIMLIIVKERTKEIGIRKALGASPLSIVGMILHESIFITTIAGFIGLLSSLMLLELVGPNIKSDYFLNPEVDFGTAITTMILLIFSGALAGFFPAYRAAKIKPIVALRDE
ncbi:ABC transporter permease [Flavobacterium cellulosilyticum]|uniref:ABC transporter permease n=1 Tax=Flavobacterium cellulosilyticum TaxID=2541731 RepID=A0A4R5CDX5_9FLAO|nr:ABC transporter permease [Flavobacterium cellulosilyticum]TDD96520.1 ABC transporter permease [Flavobacterium cellulosilyticum]